MAENQAAAAAGGERAGTGGAGEERAVAGGAGGGAGEERAGAGGAGDFSLQDILKGRIDGDQRTKNGSNMIRVFISSTFTGQVSVCARAKSGHCVQLLSVCNRCVLHSTGTFRKGSAKDCEFMK